MKYLIVGLGNPGPEYADTRHNVGFKVVERLAEKKGVAFEPNRYAETALVKHKGRSLHLIKPMTYMNLSGKAVRYYLQQGNIPLENMLVIVDELALPFGVCRLRGKGSDGGHNGLKHINELLETTHYARMRVGIGSDFPRGQQVDFVLSPFEDAEIAQLPEVVKHCVSGILSFVGAGLNRTMTQFNAWRLQPIDS